MGEKLMVRYALRKDVVFRKETDGALVYDHATGRVTPLNGTAAFMCEAIFIRQESLDEVLAGIRARWKVSDAERVKSDVEKFVAGMKMRNLVEEITPCRDPA